MDNLQVPFIIASAQVPLVLGSDIIARLQAALVHISSGHTPEDIEAVKALVAAKEPIPAWADASMTLAQLMRGILDSAIANNMVEYHTAQDLVQGITQDHQGV